MEGIVLRAFTRGHRYSFVLLRLAEKDEAQRIDRFVVCLPLSGTYIIFHNRNQYNILDKYILKFIKMKCSTFGLFNGTSLTKPTHCVKQISIRCCCKAPFNCILILCVCHTFVIFF